MTAGVAVSHTTYVLIAEPNLKRAAFYRQLLTEDGFDALVARDGQEAKDILRHNGAPRLLLAELSLPRVDGFALLADLRLMAPPEQSAAVVTSSFADLRSIAHELRGKLGISDVLARNIPVRMLRAALTRALESVADEHGAGAVANGLQHRDIGSQEHLAQLAILMAGRYRVPIVTIYLKVGHKQRLVAYASLDGIPPRHEGSNDWALIRTIVDVGEPLVIADGRNHPFFHRGSASTDNLVRGFAGVPIINASHVVFGAICLLDIEPLTLSAFELDSLAAFGRRFGCDLERRLPEPNQPTDADRTLLRLALTDALTGLANRRAGEEAMARELARAQRNQSPLSYVLCDVDQFKGVNDTYGHAAGDRVLREISKTLVAALRASDLAMRWGGDEFLLVLPGVDLQGAQLLADRAKTTIAQHAIHGLPTITVSCGIAQWMPGQTVADVFGEADARLRDEKAKRPHSR